MYVCHKRFKINQTLQTLCDKLIEWITTKHNIQTILIPFIVKDEYVSKRLIYWTVSKYAQTQNIQIIQPQSISNVFEQYTNYLRLYNRRLFDVFCRQPYLIDLELQLPIDQWRQVVQFDGNSEGLTESELQHVYEYMDGRCMVQTTIGQLNFFYWASKQGILSYIKKYESSLMENMKQDSRKRRQQQSSSSSKQKQRQYSKRQRSNNSIVILYKPCAIPV